MSEYTAIADIGDTLINLLKDNMSDLINPDMIVLLSPAEVEGQNIRLTLFLYSIVENPYLKNREGIDLHPDGLQYPPLTLDLYFLLTTYASTQIPDLTERTLEEHRILGRAMRIFYDHPVLRGSGLRGGLAGTPDELRIILNPLSLDDLNKIWTSFPNRHYRPSVSYIVTPAMIDSTRITGTKRVVVRGMEYFEIEAQK